MLRRKVVAGSIAVAQLREQNHAGIRLQQAPAGGKGFANALRMKAGGLAGISVVPSKAEKSRTLKNQIVAR
jgi:hypothetical protein